LDPPTPPPPAPPPAPPSVGVAPTVSFNASFTVSFTATMTGDIAEFDAAAYRQSVATMLNKDISQVQVTVSSARRRLSRALQSSSFSVETTVIAQGDVDASSMQVLITESISRGVLASTLLANQTGVSATFSAPVIIAPVVYPPTTTPSLPPPKTPPLPPPLQEPGSVSGEAMVIVGQNDTGSALTNNGNSTASMAAVGVVVAFLFIVVLAGGAMFMRKRVAKNRALNNVTAVSVTTTSAAPITVDIGSVSASGESATEMVKLDHDEDKI